MVAFTSLVIHPGHPYQHGAPPWPPLPARCSTLATLTSLVLHTVHPHQPGAAPWPPSPAWCSTLAALTSTVLHPGHPHQHGAQLSSLALVSLPCSSTYLVSLVAVILCISSNEKLLFSSISTFRLSLWMSSCTSLSPSCNPSFLYSPSSFSRHILS